MKRSEPESVGEVLRRLLEESQLQERLDELKAVELWPKTVGETIALECGKPTVKNGIMSVGVKNASLRNELHMSRSTLRRIINQEIGKETITEIKFVS